MMIKYPHDSENHRPVFRSRGPGFEVSWWRLAVTLYWWLSWFIATKGVAFFHISFKTWWEEVRAADDAGISHVSDYSTEFATSLLSNAEICNNWLKGFYITVGGI